MLANLPTLSMMSRSVSWVRAAQKDFQTFPVLVQQEAARILAVAACGEKGERTKPLKGLGSGIFEIVLDYRGDTFRVVYGVQLGKDVWVLHAFQKKAKKGRETPKKEIRLIQERMKRIKEVA